LRHCATNRKAAGSIPNGVTNIIPGVDTGFIRDKFQEYFLGVKAIDA
jgi:hypothetical protein